MNNRKLGYTELMERFPNGHFTTINNFFGYYAPFLTSKGMEFIAIFGCERKGVAA
jgi:hypothetical protein